MEQFVVVSGGASIYVTWLIPMCAMTHSYVCHDSFNYMEQFVSGGASRTRHQRDDSFICMPWPIHVCNTPHLNVTRSMPWSIVAVPPEQGINEMTSFGLVNSKASNSIDMFSIWYHWVMAHTRMSHLASVWWIRMPLIASICSPSDVIESWHTHEWVMAYEWVMAHTRSNASNSIDMLSIWYYWVMAHTRMSHGTHTNESRHTHEWVTAHTRMSHGTHTNESWHTHKWDMAHTRMSHGTHTNESWHT